MDEIPRKAAREVEIDHLLAEEFSCDAGFVARFVEAAGIDCPGFVVRAVAAEPAFAGDGFGDLLVTGEAGGRRVALLIEDKIDAAAAHRQAERYAAHARRMRADGWDHVFCILVAPASYRGEHAAYDAVVTLECVSALLRSPEPSRLAHRRGIVDRALDKRRTGGVRMADEALHRMKSAYLDHAAAWCRGRGVPLAFPPLCESYHSGDSWVDGIRHAALPPHVSFRHRLWVSVKHDRGQVDLIVSLADARERNRLKGILPEGATLSPFSKGKGVRISVPLPAMRQSGGFSQTIADAALGQMVRLAAWYPG